MTNRLPLAICTVALAFGCQSRGSEPEREPREAPTLPSSPWAYASAPAWVHVDLEVLRGDDRFVSVWAAAGEESDDPLAALVASADRWIVSWPEPTFTERLNVAVGVDEHALDVLVPLEGRTEYAAGRGTVIGHPDREWVYATPAPGILLTGTPEAVRTAVGRPCEDCSGPTSGFSAQLTMTDGHRRLSSIVVDEPAMQHLIASVASVEAEAVLGLGMDLVVRVDTVAGGNPADVRALTEFGIEVARREFSTTEDFAGLLDGTRIVPTESGVRVDWEIGSHWLSAFAEAASAELE